MGQFEKHKGGTGMFVVTLRKGGMKKAAVVCACGALLIASAIGINALRIGDDKAAQATAALPQQIAGAEDVATFLRGYGAEADVATAAVNTVTVPRKWDESFQAFNDVIKQSGLDLKSSKGKKVDKWAVMIPAQCTEAVKTYAVVLAYKNEAVATYLLQKPSGEVLPLMSAAQTGAPLPLTDEEKEANAGFAEGDNTRETVTVTDSAAQQAGALIDEAAMPTE